MWVYLVPLHQAKSGDPEPTAAMNTHFLFTGAGLPTCPPPSASQGPQQAPTCDWPVIDGPANAGGRAAPGHTAKPQPVPEAQAAVPRQGGEGRQCQDGEVYAAAGAARGVLGDAGVGAGVLALWAKGRVRLRTVPMPGMGHHVPRTHSPAGRTASTWLGFTTARPPAFPPMALHVRNLGPDRAIVTVTIYRAATSARPHARRWCCISSFVLTVSEAAPTSGGSS